MPHCSETWDTISRYIYTGLREDHYERMDEGRKHNDPLFDRLLTAQAKYENLVLLTHDSKFPYFHIMEKNV